MINLLDLDKQQMKAMFPDRPYRGSQVFSWVFGKAVPSIGDMTNLSKALREELSKEYTISYPERLKVQVSNDGTEKHAYRLHDGLVIESVLMPEKSHWSLCVSSQAGCAMGCAFCYTATMGFHRNLEVSEIVSQVLHLQRAYPDRQIRNIVFMGMGEPLLNYGNVVKAIGILTDPEGPQFSKRRITVSTCGIVPGLKTLHQDTEAALAVSLNAPTDEVRQRLMPVTKKYPLAVLMDALRSFGLPNRRRVTIEYVLVRGVNDSIRDARELIRILHGLKVKVNLIPFNPWPGCALEAPDPGAVSAFEDVLKDSPYAVMVRKEKGRDILAACGQLAGSTDSGG
ncbi:MAG TPA: 23S rRNA (adenine(2503)-C(2))-methyltransferase RlmN [Deltaproteobacteria bacterium]|nr:23S rRNA (adenine(2503)-C(2))-methyltransferase RlmN [Deltaproteobacteria bacterium]HOI05839.1 23S rRNA (adenine(2503)-C(2))-methyltransferase RlmN [Deltaproteobacteria bacterium]